MSTCRSLSGAREEACAGCAPEAGEVLSSAIRDAARLCGLSERKSRGKKQACDPPRCRSYGSERTILGRGMGRGKKLHDIPGYEKEARSKVNPTLVVDDAHIAGTGIGELAARPSSRAL